MIRGTAHLTTDCFSGADRSALVAELKEQIPTKDHPIIGRLGILKLTSRIETRVAESRLQLCCASFNYKGIYHT
jgi:hypothetical protein